jgi:hypothetical protein
MLQKSPDQYGFLSKIHGHHAKGLETLSNFSLHTKLKSAPILEIHTS